MSQELLRLNMEFATALSEFEEVASKISNAVNHGENINVAQEQKTIKRLHAEAMTINSKLIEELDK